MPTQRITNTWSNLELPIEFLKRGRKLENHRETQSACKTQAQDQTQEQCSAIFSHHSCVFFHQL